MHFVPGIREQADPDQAVRQVLDYIERVRDEDSVKPWLVVYDNVEDSGAIKDVVPRLGADVLITSRWQDWQGVADVVPVDTFPQDVAVEYLLEEARGETEESARTLAAALGCLLLALNHARTYCRKARCRFGSYVERLSDLIRHAPRNAAYPESVYATFDLAIDQAVQVSADAERLMGVIAFYAPEGIPRSLLLDPEGSETVSEEAIVALADVSLLVDSQRDEEEESMTVHRMVQAVARGRLGSDRTAVIAECVRRMNHRWPGGSAGENPENWPQCSQLLPHALSVIDSVEGENEQDEGLALLLNKVGFYLGSRGLYQRQEPLYRKDLEISQRVLGEEHPDTAVSYNNVASNLDDQGRYEEAEPLYRKGLDIREQVLGETHPSTAVSYNNVAGNLDDLGRYEEAEPLYRKAIAILKAVFPDGHPHIDVMESNLNLLLEKMGKK